MEYVPAVMKISSFKMWSDCGMKCPSCNSRQSNYVSRADSEDWFYCSTAGDGMSGLGPPPGDSCARDNKS